MQVVAMVAVVAITLGTVGVLLLSRNARHVAHQGLASASRLASPKPSPTTIPMPSWAQLMAPSTNVVWVLVANSVLFRSTNQGTTWEQRGLPMQSVGRHAISFINDSEGWFLAQGSPETQCNGALAVVLHTTDGGAQWKELSSLPQAQCKDYIYFYDSTHGFVTAWDDSHRPTIYRTSDGGKTWSGSTLPDPPDFKTSPGGFTLRATTFKRFGNTLYVEGWGSQDGDIPNRQYMFRSTDNGATWSWLMKIPSRYIAMVSESRWLQLIWPGQSMESINSGQQWHPYASDFSSDTPVGGPQIVFADSQVGYAEGRGALQRTIDGGLHWERIATPGTYAPIPSPSPTVSQIEAPPDPARLTSQKCSAAPAPTPARSVESRYTIRVPSGWTDTGDYVHTESLLLELTAPASYGNSRTRLQFLALPYDAQRDFGTSTTAHAIAADEAATHRFTYPGSTATSALDCPVGGESAAAFGYADANEHGYWLLFIHRNSLLGVRLFGAGGIGDEAIQDALGMIGSIAWTF
jgi:photosystem II stability/assembly factor-like uncharacterized protein